MLQNLAPALEMSEAKHELLSIEPSGMTTLHEVLL